MDTEDLKNSLEQQVESYKRRLNNQVTGRFSVFRVLKGLKSVKFDPMRDHLVDFSSAGRAVVNCIHHHESRIH